MLTSTKPPKCRVCKGQIIDGNPMHRLHDHCMDEWITTQRAKMNRTKAKAERVTTRQRKEAMQTLPDLKRKAQFVFNAFIRARDQAAGHTCISSGRVLDWTGNATDCGHYRSVGAAQHLRYNEDNAHAQTKHDNRFLSGSAVDYRLGLIVRIGLDRVEALECDNTIKKWGREELVEIRALYTAKLKQLKATQ